MFRFQLKKQHRLSNTMSGLKKGIKAEKSLHDKHALFPNRNYREIICPSCRYRKCSSTTVLKASNHVDIQMLGFLPTKAFKLNGPLGPSKLKADCTPKNCRIPLMPGVWAETGEQHRMA